MDTAHNVWYYKAFASGVKQTKLCNTDRYNLTTESDRTASLVMYVLDSSDNMDSD